jgi:hypothetical protein
MGLTHRIDPVAEHVRIVGVGTLTMPEILAAVERAVADPALRPHYTAILDIREGDYTAELQDGDVFVHRLKELERYFQNRFALLVPESLHFLGTMFCLLAKAGGVDRMKCFVDLDRAREWCGLPK